MKRFAIVKLTGVLLAGAALGAASVTAVAFHANSASPQFFAALAASLVAAAALIFVALYNDFLARHREEEARIRERTAATIDLHFWLDHCVAELDFIAGALTKLHTKLVSEDKIAIEISPDQFKQIISSHFYDELLERAKSASRLTPEIAAYVAGAIYNAFTSVDRILVMRQASDQFVPTTDQVLQYAEIILAQKTKLERANSLIGEYLIYIGALPKFSH